ncbi:DNA translocase FtsK 4TM domain-containing protein [Dyella terrae]|uniref:DNA translocase FtsK 4TM domain-containing protein n=1 Tax=Dyella terrae TaxID=522259 RepID=UPI001EFD8E54|nr:DNA translocase FtsK 4TM domain-containing protein [Dyella terrae]
MLHFLFGAFGLSTLWLVPLIWRVGRSLLKRRTLSGGGEGTIRFWLGALLVLLASATLEGLLIDQYTDAADAGGSISRALSHAVGGLLGGWLSVLAMLAVIAMALPWYLGVTWPAMFKRVSAGVDVIAAQLQRVLEMIASQTGQDVYRPSFQRRGATPRTRRRARAPRGTCRYTSNPGRPRICRRTKARASCGTFGVVIACAGLARSLCRAARESDSRTLAHAKAWTCSPAGSESAADPPRPGDGRESGGRESKRAPCRCCHGGGSISPRRGPDDGPGSGGIVAERRRFASIHRCSSPGAVRAGNGGRAARRVLRHGSSRRARATGGYARGAGPPLGSQ